MPPLVAHAGVTPEDVVGVYGALDTHSVAVSPVTPLVIASTDVRTVFHNCHPRTDAASLAPEDWPDGDI